MALVNMYLTIGSVKIRFLGYTPEIFHSSPMQPCGASLSIHYNGNRRRQLYWSNVMDWPLPPQYKKRPMHWANQNSQELRVGENHTMHYLEFPG